MYLLNLDFFLDFCNDKFFQLFYIFL